MATYQGRSKQGCPFLEAFYEESMATSLTSRCLRSDRREAPGCAGHGGGDGAAAHAADAWHEADAQLRTRVAGLGCLN